MNCSPALGRLLEADRIRVTSRILACTALEVTRRSQLRRPGLARSGSIATCSGPTHRSKLATEGRHVDRLTAAGVEELSAALTSAIPRRDFPSLCASGLRCTNRVLVNHASAPQSD